MWTPTYRDCRCGHKPHIGKRCGGAQVGCPCHEYEEADEVTSPSLEAFYYSGRYRD